MLVSLVACSCLLSLLGSAGGERKHPRGNRIKTAAEYDLLENPETPLPSDQQIAIFLRGGDTETLRYWSALDDAPLAFTLAACASTIHWKIFFSNENRTGNPLFQSTTGQDFNTKHLISQKGTYSVEIQALEGNTHVFLYISTEPNGPQPLQSPPGPIKLIRKQKRRKLTLRWNPSRVDPQSTTYCAVISKRKHPSLCAAQTQAHLNKQLQAASQTVINWRETPRNPESELDPNIICTAKQTHLTVYNLIKDQQYFFHIFATDSLTKLTYLLAYAQSTFSSRSESVTLTENKATFINLKKFDGKAVLKYKPGKLKNVTLKLFFMPCGGSIDIEVLSRGQPIVQRKRIEGFGTVSVPLTSSRIYIKVYSTNREELRKISGVEVYATSNSAVSLPLPNMPNESTVQEYTSLRRCDSVTVGWLPSPSQSKAHYCVVITESRIREAENYKMPNQCGLENRLKKSADFTLKYCKDIEHKNRPVVIEKITHLKPGRNYIIQVTVKKPKGKTLSYDLVQVQTTSHCRFNKKRFMNLT